MGSRSDKHKTPEKLRQQVSEQNPEPTDDGPDRSAEGITLPRPEGSEFFGNLAKLSEPKRPSG